jgi:hypothetical protein
MHGTWRYDSNLLDITLHTMKVRQFARLPDRSMEALDGIRWVPRITLLHWMGTTYHIAALQNTSSPSPREIEGSI